MPSVELWLCIDMLKGSMDRMEDELPMDEVRSLVAEALYDCIEFQIIGWISTSNFIQPLTIIGDGVSLLKEDASDPNLRSITLHFKRFFEVGKGQNQSYG